MARAWPSSPRILTSGDGTVLDAWPFGFGLTGALTAIIFAAAISYGYRRRNRSREKLCPTCNGVIQEAYFRCPHCGATLKHNCPVCSRVVEQIWRYCPFCNQPLKPSGTDSFFTLEDENRNGRN